MTTPPPPDSPAPPPPATPPPSRERRWTILLVPHTSDASRSFSLSERTLRRAAWTVGVLSLAVVLAFSALLWRVQETNRALATAWQNGDHDVDSLQARLDSSGEHRRNPVARTTHPGVGWGYSNGIAVVLARVLRHKMTGTSSPEQQRSLSVVRDSLRREIRNVSRTTDSLVVRAVDANGRAQRLADSVTQVLPRRP
ncbi:MAG: hypothetical protein U0132_07145 [Gemmatimonadaceae bacterium]